MFMLNLHLLKRGIVIFSYFNIYNEIKIKNAPYPSKYFQIVIISLNLIYDLIFLLIKIKILACVFWK